MKAGHLVTGIACMAMLIFLVQGVSAVGVERSVIPAGPSTYTIHLYVPENTVAGITEVLPPDMEPGAVSLPAGQFRVNRSTLHLAVIGGGEVTYVLNTPRDPAGLIQGTWVDLMAGEEGRVTEGATGGPGPEKTQELPKPTSTPRAGTPLLLCVIALGLATLVAFSRCKGSDGE